MKIIESRKRNIKTFDEIAVGTVFRFNNNIFIKTEDFYSVKNIEEYFNHTDIMEDVDDMRLDFCCYNAYLLSGDDYYTAFSSIDDYVAVEIVETELHIV